MSADVTGRGRRELVVDTGDGARLAVVVLDGARAGGPRRSPDPATVVLSHGWTCTRVVWHPVAERLHDRGCTVVLYDQRGHGDSTTGRDAISLPRLGRDLAAVLDRLDLHDVVVGGHSMGGFSALAYAVGCPDHRWRVRSLALVGTAAHGLRRLPWPAVQAHLLGGFASWVSRQDRMAARFARTVFGRAPRPEHLALTRELFAATSPAVRSACFRAFIDMDLREPLTEVDIPAVVVAGQHDQLTPPHLGRALAEALPEARYLRLDDVGHMLPLEAPAEVAAVIAALAG